MSDSVPERVLNFGSSEEEEPQITPDNLDDHASKLPRPTGYRILILPFKPNATTKGGIMLAKQTMEKEQLATIVGVVVSLGPDAYKDSDKFAKGPWCKEGDWVCIGRYAGARFKIDGGEIRIINDDEVIATIEHPDDVYSV